ncbi:MAG: porin family protein [Chitinophagaceae bacterium]
MKWKVLIRRKNVLLCLFALGFGVTAFAQEQQTNAESSLTPKFGVKGGINLSNLYVDEADDENMKLGLNLGFYSKIPLTKGLSIQPELIYSSKGAKLTYNNFILGKGEYRFNLNYVELPLLAVINVANNINLHAGGYVSYLVSANIKDMDDDGTINNIRELKAENFNRFDYGLVGGLGIDVQNFTIGARYNYGLKEIGESGSLSGNLTKNSKNSVISLYVGLGF